MQYLRIIFTQGMQFLDPDQGHGLVRESCSRCGIRNNRCITQNGGGNNSLYFCGELSLTLQHQRNRMKALFSVEKNGDSSVAADYPRWLLVSRAPFLCLGSLVGPVVEKVCMVTQTSDIHKSMKSKTPPQEAHMSFDLYSCHVQHRKKSKIVFTCLQLV